MIRIIIGVGCLVREVFPKGFLWAGVLLYAATGVVFVIGRLRKNTTWYHTHIWINDKSVEHEAYSLWDCNFDFNARNCLLSENDQQQ